MKKLKGGETVFDSQFQLFQLMLVGSVTFDTRLTFIMGGRLWGALENT